MNELYIQAITQFQQGNFDESGRLLETLQDSDEYRTRAHQLLGFIALKRKEPGQAMAHMKACLEANPEDVTTLLNLARYFLPQGMLKEARDIFHRVEKLDSENFEACLGLGKIYNDSNRLEQARDYLLRAGACDGENFQVPFALGVVYRKQGRIEDAIASFIRAVELKPGYAPALIQLGVMTLTGNDTRRALQYFQQAVKAAPDNVSALECLAKTHARLKQYDAAASCFRKLLTLQPDSLDATLGLAEILRLQKHTDACEKLLSDAGKRFPDNALVINKRAKLMNDVGRHAEAADAMHGLLQRWPDSVESLNILGASLWQQGDYTAALAQFDQAIRLSPDNAESHFNRGFMLLLMGDYAAAWPEYEWRVKYFSPRLGERFPAAKSWQGQPLENRTLLVRHEQGVGDFFMFVRYLAALQTSSGKVLIQVPEATGGFFDETPGLQAIARSQIPQSYDYHVALPSLPGLTNTTLDNIPGRFPYLEAGDKQCRRMQRYIRARKSLRVGIVWAGNPDNPIDKRRSCSFRDIAPLLDIKGTRFYSLQVGAKAAELDSAKVTDLSPRLDDYTCTAAAIQLLDVVVGVDTSVIHLAGALGKPLLVALPKIPPDWRWLLERDDSPWYPSARLFRQRDSGDWEPVFAGIRQTLAELARDHVSGD